MKVVFMGTPWFARVVLEALIGSHHEIVAVYTKPKCDVIKYAQEQGLKVMTPRSLRGCDMPEEADIAVVAAYGLIIPDTLLDKFKHGCVNMHPSLLPKWRGAAPIERSIMAGELSTGVSIIQLDSGLDSGDIFCADKIDITPEDDGYTVGYKLAQIGSGMLLDVLNKLEHNINVLKVKQDETHATYAQKISPTDELIRWEDDGTKIFNITRALYPNPCAHVLVRGERIKIIKALFTPSDAKESPGTVIDNQFGVAVKGGIFRPVIVQKAGGKQMDVPSFLRGFKLDQGTKLH